MRKLENIVRYFEDTPLTFRTWCVSFSAIIVTRFFVENLLTSLKSKELIVFLGLLLQTVLFFTLAYVIIVLYLRMVTRWPIDKLASVVLWGQWIIVFPPVIDKLIFGDRQFYSFYLFDSVTGLAKRLITFFGDHPDFGITYGTRIEVLLVVVMLGIYVFIKSRRWFYSTAVALGLYVILFLLGAFPSLVAFVVRGPSEGLMAVDSVAVAKTFLTGFRFFNTEIRDFLYLPLNYRLNLIYNLLLFGAVMIYGWITGREKFVSLFKNIRFPQTIFNCGLLITGIGLGMFYFPHNAAIEFFSIAVVFNLLLAVLSAWYFSVFINDIYDTRIDEITNAYRPLIQKLFSREEYIDRSLVFLVFSLTSSLVVGIKFFLLIIAYHFLTFVYSAYPFRLKRFVGVASLLSAFASLIFFAMGFILVSDNSMIDQFPWRVTLMMFVGYALAIPLKDIKDIEGDRRDGVYTLPVLLGEEKTRLLLAVLILGCYFFSVYIFNERALWLPAFLCGSLSYWVITNKKIQPRNVNWQVLLITSFYVMILAAILFAIHKR